MDILNTLFKLGVATWVTDIITPAPNNAGAGSTNFQIGKNLPTDVGFIYGLSTISDGIGPDAQPIPTTTQNRNMFVTLQNGATQFFETFRMVDLQNDYAGVPIVRDERYLPVNIPVFDLSKSNFINPNIYTGFNIHLYLWYIKTSDWEKVKDVLFKK